MRTRLTGQGRWENLRNRHCTNSYYFSALHPIADLFPMMTDEELANLAADIKANGLIHPIVVDKDGVLIDGRNRDRACEIAGIEPATVLFEGDLGPTSLPATSPADT